MEFDRIIPLYMEDCHARQLRPKAMQSYEQALRLFSVWLEEHHGVIHIEGVTDYHTANPLTCSYLSSESQTIFDICNKKCKPCKTAQEAAIKKIR